MYICVCIVISKLNGIKRRTIPLKAKRLFGSLKVARFPFVHPMYNVTLSPFLNYRPFQDVVTYWMFQFNFAERTNKYTPNSIFLPTLHADPK